YLSRDGDEYIESLALNKKEKTLINQEKLQKIKAVLLDPINTTQYTSAFRYWASIFSENEISNEFGLENIQELVNDLDDLIDNANSIPLMTTESSSLNQDSNIEMQRNLVDDNNHKNQDTDT
ncbi:19174_t:CDS:2, partial [Cetraspora pellucida]